MIKALNPVVYDDSCILSTVCSPLWFIDIDILEAEGTHCILEIIKMVTWAILYVCVCISVCVHACTAACLIVHILHVSMYALVCEL